MTCLQAALFGVTLAIIAFGALWLGYEAKYIDWPRDCSYQLETANRESGKPHDLREFPACAYLVQTKG